jgi:hypothetical protein
MTDDDLRARLIEALDAIARAGSGFISPASNADALLPLVHAYGDERVTEGFRSITDSPREEGHR